MLRCVNYRHVRISPGVAHSCTHFSWSVHFRWLWQRGILEIVNSNNSFMGGGSVSDPYHLVGSGSVSGNVDMDPSSAKN